MTSLLLTLLGVVLIGTAAAVNNFRHAHDARSPCETQPARRWIHLAVSCGLAATATLTAGAIVEAMRNDDWRPWPVFWGLSTLAVAASVANVLRAARNDRRLKCEMRLRPGARDLFRRASQGGRVLRLVAGGLMVLAPLAVGCASDAHLSPRDQVLAPAERGIRASFVVIDAFVRFDGDNRAYVRSTWPDVHAFAEYLRGRDPGMTEPRSTVLLRAAIDADRRYRAIPSDDHRAALDVKLAQVAEWARRAREYLTQMQSPIRSSP